VSSEEIELLAGKNVQDYIHEHQSEDAQLLLLKNKSLFGLNFGLIADQIIARKKVLAKVPLLLQAPGIVFPPAMNLEQSSSQATAQLKKELIEKEIKGSHLHLADLTGGFGIDSLFLSTLAQTLDFIEPNEKLLNLVKHNFRVLNLTNVQFHQTSAEKFLHDNNQIFDLIYLDPSRRDKSSKKVFRLEDCDPVFSTIQESLFNFSDFILIKTSPLLDIAQGLKEIPFVKNIYIVSVDNECKELLFLCKKNSTAVARVETINLLKDKRQSFSFDWGEEAEAASSFSEPLTYLYEPNASVLKSGCFKLIGERFLLKKIHPNTHLYTSSQMLNDFPGRIFKIENLKPDLKKELPDQKVNVLTRNYPLTPEEIKKKWRLKDGGENYLIGFSGEKQKYLVLASKKE
jgi:hypothetical protein